MTCLTAGALALTLSGQAFTLEWQHSVEHIAWRESWVVEGQTLRLVEARVKGSGAGMEAGEGAKLQKGWWVWQPTLEALPHLTLAASGATGGGWRLCDEFGQCTILGSKPEAAIIVEPCSVDVKQKTGPRERGPENG